MECLHCGKKLGVVRKLQKDEFCSAAHRKAYAKKQDDDALDFLMKSKPVLRPPVQPAATSAAPPPVEPKPILVVAQFVAVQVAPVLVSALPIRKAQPLETARAAILPARAHPAGPRLLRSPHASAASLTYASPADRRKPAPAVAAPFEAVRPRARVTIAHPIWIGEDRPAEPKQPCAGFVATRPTSTDLSSHPLSAGEIAKFTVSPVRARTWRRGIQPSAWRLHDGRSHNDPPAPRTRSSATEPPGKRSPRTFIYWPLARRRRSEER